MKTPAQIPGTIIACAMDIDPKTYLATSGGYVHAQYFGPTPRNRSGWILCAGQPYLRSMFPQLYQAIGDLYGKSSGDLRLPNYQGQFLRGLDTSAQSSANTDRTKLKNGVQNGVGSTQKDMIRSHGHFSYEPGGSKGGAGSQANKLSALQPNSPPLITTPDKVYLVVDGQLQTTAATGEETRPANIYVNYLIYAGLPGRWH